MGTETHRTEHKPFNHVGELVKKIIPLMGTETVLALTAFSFS